MSSQPEAGDGISNLGNHRDIVKKYKFKSIKMSTVPMSVPPYDIGLCSDYAISKEETRNFTDIPESDTEYIQPPVEHIIECRRLRDNEDKLVEMRKTYAETRIDLNAQWDLLHHDELELKKSFWRFNQFVRENLEKRERASKKTGDDILLKEKRTAEVEHIREKMKVAARCRRNLDKVIRASAVFEGYLNDVVKQTAGGFKTIDDVINKYETMNAARLRLVQRQKEGMAGLEEVTRRLATIRDDYDLAALGLNNTIASLEERFKNVNVVTLTEERLVEKIQQASVQAMGEAQVVKCSIRNIYRHMCQRRSTAARLPLHDYENMLVFIKESIEETIRAQIILATMSTMPTIKNT